MPPVHRCPITSNFLGKIKLHAAFFAWHVIQYSTTQWPFEKYNTFDWDDAVHQAFQLLKVLMATVFQKPLQYCDHLKTTSLQADTSNRTSVHASYRRDNPLPSCPSPSDTQTHYMNVERELMALMFTCTGFHVHLYGRLFTVESNQKPLRMITMKNFISAPPKIQGMLLYLQLYDLVIKYWQANRWSWGMPCHVSLTRRNKQVSFLISL